MKLFQGTRTLPAPFASSVLTIGNFDGVHLGHRELIERVLKRSHALGVPSVVMTFEPHPVKVLYPDRHLKRIFDFEDQARELERLGVDVLVVEPFSREFSQLSPELYLQDWIYRPFVPAALIVGYDFTFGSNRAGTLEFLKSKAKALGIDVDIVPPVKFGEHLVSSTRIRQALADGDVELATHLLGRHFYLHGLIEKGAGRGRTIGVPTANLRASAETVPAEGVYAVWADVNGKRWPAALNIGRNPTFQNVLEAPLSIEAHLIGFTGDIYGMPMRLEFVRRLREERRFPSKDALVAQIRSDIQNASRLLGGEPV